MISQRLFEVKHFIVRCRFQVSNPYTKSAVLMFVIIFFFLKPWPNAPFYHFISPVLWAYHYQMLLLSFLWPLILILIAQPCSHFISCMALVPTFRIQVQLIRFSMKGVFFLSLFGARNLKSVHRFSISCVLKLEKIILFQTGKNCFDCTQ